MKDDSAPGGQRNPTDAEKSAKTLDGQFKLYSDRMDVMCLCGVELRAAAGLGTGGKVSSHPISSHTIPSHTISLSSHPISSHREILLEVH